MSAFARFHLPTVLITQGEPFEMDMSNYIQGQLFVVICQQAQSEINWNTTVRLQSSAVVYVTFTKKFLEGWAEEPEWSR